MSNGIIHPMQTGSNFNKQNKKVVKKKPNPLKDQKVVDYLDAKFLSKFTNDQGKILPRRITGVSAYQQRQIAQAVKYARHLALMPFVAMDTN
jgi:small subunit ribosomal protein S18